MIKIARPSVSHIVVRAGRPVQIVNRPRSVETRVIQTTTPLLIGEGSAYNEIIDGGNF